MANFIGLTSSNGIQVDDEQQAKIDELLAKYYIAMEDYITGEKGEFGIWGYDWLNIRGVIIQEEGDEPKPDYDNDTSEEFFEELRKILKPDQKLVVMSVGYEKLRYVAAMKITVTPDEVKWEHL